MPLPEISSFWKQGRHHIAAMGGALHADDRGMLSFVTLVVVLGLLVLISLVGNAAYAVREKLIVQNAADSLALSTTTWMARGLNAITAVNHVTGDLTSLVIMHRAIGGPSSDPPPNYPSTINEMLNEQIDAFKNAASSDDKMYVDSCVDIVKNNDRDFKAGAALYDSRLLLKRDFATLVQLRFVISIAEQVPYLRFLRVFRYLANAYMGFIAKEWLILYALDEFAAGTSKDVDFLQEQVLPGLSSYGEVLIGTVTTNLGGVAGAGIEGTFKQVVQASVEQLSQEMRVTAHLYPNPRTTPSLTLPLQAEPAPQSGGEYPKSLSGTSTLFRPLQAMMGNSGPIQAAFGSADNFRKGHQEAIKLLQKGTGLTGKISKDAQKEIAKLTDELEKLDKVFKVLDSLAGINPRARDGQPGEDSNYCWDKSICGELENASESRSQWMRASYPYLDVKRGRVLNSLNKNLPLANFSTFFIHWTNRFALTVCWQLRRGTSGGKDSSRGGQGVMYMMADSTFDTKGEEVWTTDDLKADKMFSVIVLASRNPKPLIFGDKIFRWHPTVGPTAFAQAMVYNANGRGNAGSSTQQRQTGWDTLNWKPGQAVPEYGAPVWQDPGFPTINNLLSSLTLQGLDEFRFLFPYDSQRRSDGPDIHLNWQAKLVPVTPARLGELSKDIKDDGKVSELLEKMTESPIQPTH